MTESAKFFGRSLSAEWRTAAEVYRRVLIVWSDDRRAQDSLVRALCDDLVPPPRSVEALRNALLLSGAHEDHSVRSGAQTIECSAARPSTRTPTVDEGDRHVPG